MSGRLADFMLWPLADVSTRWGLLILALAAWFAIRPPRRAATRYTLGIAALLAGPALLLAPRWDAYVYGGPPAPAPIKAPDFSPPRPLDLAELRAIETPTVPEPRDHAQPPPSTPVATPPSPIDRPRLAAKAAVAAWLAGTLLMLARLALGVRALRRWARKATPATADDLALLAACREDIPTSRPVRLMRHPQAAAPVMAGGLRPAIMLPPDWDAWPADRRRAAMLHELAHVRRYDDAGKLLEELLRAPAWFHPGVAWLLARIDRERELLCDEAAVAAGDDPKGLARLLLDLSRSPSPRHLPSASLPFLTRRTTAVRIRRLLEDDMPRTLSRPSLARTLLLGPAALAALLALGTLRIREAPAQDAPATRRSPAQFRGRSFDAIAATLQESPTGRTMIAVPEQDASAIGPVEPTPPPSADAYGSVNFQISFVKNTDVAEPTEGRVADAEGRPIAGATVLIGGPMGSEAKPIAVVSDEQGVFARDGELKRASTFLAWKEGYAPTRGLVLPDTVSDGRFTLVLPRASAFAGILVDESDRPIPGASLRVAAVALPGPNSSVSFESYRREEVEGTPIATALTTTTADDGAFLLPSAWAEGRGLYLAIVGPDGRHRVIPQPTSPPRPSMGPNGFLVLPIESNGFLVPRPGDRPRLATIPAARIEGRIVSKAANFAPSKFRASVYSASSLGYGVGLLTDDEGRFVFDGLQPGEKLVSVSGVSPIATAVQFHGRVKSVPGRIATIRFDMDQGVEVAGVVRSGVTGKPLAGVQLQVDGPAQADDVLMVASNSPTTDAEGRYRAWVLPGVAEVRVVDAPPGNLFRSLSFEIPKGVATFDAPPLELGAATTIRGRLASSDGGGFDGTHVNVADPFPPPPAQPSRGAFANDRGEFAFDVDPARHKLGTPIKLRIQPIGGVSREIEAAPDADGVYVVKLDEPSANEDDPPAAPPPAARKGVARTEESAVAPIDGTVVDPDGKPVAGATVVVDGYGGFGRRSLTTDDAGRFSTPGAKGEGRVEILVVKSGYAPVATSRLLEPTLHKLVQGPLVIKLSRPAPFAGTLVDEADRPIAGATVRVIRTAFSSDLDGDGMRIATNYYQFPRDRTAGTAVEKALVATTAEDGSFTLPEAAPAGYGLRFEIQTADGRPRIVQRPKWDRSEWSLEHQGFVVPGPEGRSQVKTLPAARIEGKVVSNVAGTDVSRLRAWFQDSRPDRDAPPDYGNRRVEVLVDVDGRFAFDGLELGTVNVFVSGEGEAESWTYRAVKDLKLEPGRTSAATIELIEGVEVTGLVKAEKGDRPVAGAEVAVYGPFRPKTGGATLTHSTDADGRYRFRLPAGETDLSISSLPEGYLPVNQRPEGRRTVTIPEGGRFEVPPLVAVANLGPAAAVEKAAPGR